MQNLWKLVDPFVNPKNDGSMWSCMGPTCIGCGSLIAAGYTLLVPQPWSGVLWALAALMFSYAVRSFVRISE